MRYEEREKTERTIGRIVSKQSQKVLEYCQNLTSSPFYFSLLSHLLPRLLPSTSAFPDLFLSYIILRTLSDSLNAIYCIVLYFMYVCVYACMSLLEEGGKDRRAWSEILTAEQRKGRGGGLPCPSYLWDVGSLWKEESMSSASYVQWWALSEWVGSRLHPRWK